MRKLAAWAVALPPRTQDLALALALALANVGSLIPEARQLSLPYLAFALVVLQALPLTWRRRWPVPVLFAVGLPSQVYALLGIPYAPVALGPMIGLYTVMNRCSTRTRWVICVLALAGIIQAQLTPNHIEPYDGFIGVLEFTAAGMAGLLSRTRRAYLQEVEARAAQQAADHDRDLALAAAQERTRIARELHDVVAHHVSLIAVQSQAAVSLLPGRPAEAGTAVQIIGQTAREALTELRRLLGVLRAPPGPADPAGRRTSMLPAPSISELGDVLARVRSAGIAVDLQVRGEPGRLAPGVDLTVYRIVQEALTNTVRHSGASQAAVTITHEPGYVTVTVTDTGRGPAAVAIGAAPPLAGPGLAAGDSGAPTAGPGGFGLAGIAERVASCGGRLTVGPGDAGGFAVTARLPAP